MLAPILSLYRRIFGRKVFLPLNKLLFFMSLRGLGILNFENKTVSGERHFLQGISRSVRRAFDIGAHVGEYAVELRKQNRGMEIYAFEPHPVSFEKLRCHGSRFDFKAFNLGFGRSPGTFRLYDYAHRPGSSHASLYREVIEDPQEGDVSEYAVEITTLDAFSSEQGVEEIDLVKIDTEGSEYEILLGARDLLARKGIRLIHFEFNRMNVSSRVFLGDFYELLSDFEFYRMLPDGLIPLKNYDPLFFEIYAYQNIVAVRRDIRNCFGFQERGKWWKKGSAGSRPNKMKP